MTVRANREVWGGLGPVPTVNAILAVLVTARAMMGNKRRHEGGSPELWERLDAAGTACRILLCRALDGWIIPIVEVAWADVLA